MTEIPHCFTRYYQESTKTVEQCAQHGAHHRAYGWSKQLDPRWNESQIVAYLAAYEGKP
jgi:hypothetical protein